MNRDLNKLSESCGYLRKRGPSSKGDASLGQEQLDDQCSAIVWVSRMTREKAPEIGKDYVGLF